jgi:hypothetical protein
MTSRSTIRRCWIAISMIAVASTAAAETGLEPHRAAYSVTRGDSEIGRIEVELRQREDGLWHYRFESLATAWYVRLLGVSATESAWFQWRDGELLPLTYHHVSREPGRDRYWQHRYDWQRGSTETRTHAGELEIPLSEGLVDPLTLRLAAVQRIRDQAPEFESFELSVIERDEIERQSIRFLRTERIEVAGRCYRTAVFKRFRKPGSSRNYAAWHARELDWMPVRIAHEDDGKPITLSLESWHSETRELPPTNGCTDSETKPSAIADDPAADR